MGDFGGLRRRWAMKLLSARAADACRSWIYFHILDVFGWPIGPLSFFWPHEGTNRVQFLGVRPAWALAQDLLVPAQGVQVAPTYGLVCVPYPRDVLYEAPRQPAGLPLTPERARAACYLGQTKSSTLREGCAHFPQRQIPVQRSFAQQAYRLPPQNGLSMSKQPLSRVSPLVAPGIACVEMVGAGECGRNGGGRATRIRRSTATIGWFS
jgi:hypothetical protein